ncbi:MAG: hypothetical protein IT495_19940 [Gammaproteobacteria bacterium]|nr:hypothetical protein [Gammaproteobacteria bacterium]
MTSSLRSRFSLADRRAICLAGDRVFVHHWNRGALAESYVFDATDAGLAQFERYLAETPPMPARMLVDVIEEEYRQETIPHAFGKDRKALIGRKKARLFRGTPYCHALMQGRETEGRRDDRLLLTALTNPTTIQPWAEALSRRKVPLAATTSLPILSATLLGKLGIRNDNVLLVTLQSSSGLRQSFFRGGELKVSRLAKMPRLGTVPFGEYVLGELEKLRRYLNSLRLMGRDSPLETYILSHGEPLEDLRRNCRDTEQVRYHLLDVADAAERLGVVDSADTPYSDRLFAQLLLQGRVTNHYASDQETHYFSLHRARIGMLAASIFLVFVGATWSGFNFIEAVALSQEALGAEQKADFYQARYHMARESLPPTAVEPADIERAVDIVDRLASHRPTPVVAMQTVSAAIDAFPAFRIDRLDWGSASDPEQLLLNERPQTAARAGTEPRMDTRVGAEPPAGGPRFDYYQIARIEGHIEPFDGNYRRALDEVNRFAEALRAQAGVYSVRVLLLPLDVSSGARLEGTADGERRGDSSAFAVRLVMGVGDGTG